MKRSYTYLKGLLTVALAAFTGWIWAATPVATWTDFSQLSSGDYTLTKDSTCTVNTDGSITLAGTGLSLPVSGKQITVVMDVSAAPTTADVTIASVKMNGSYVSLKSSGTQLVQSWNNSGNYGTFDWTPGTRQTIVLGTMQSNPSGTTTWIDGVQKATASNLMTTSGSLQNVYIGSYDGTSEGSATGMIVHSLRIYSTKLSANDVYVESYRPVISYCVNSTTSNDDPSGLAIGEDQITRVANKHWNNISCPNGGNSETANSYTLSSAKDNNGKVWGIALSGTAGGQWWYNNDKTSLGEKGGNYADGPWVMNFKGIPFTKYDVVLYMATDNSAHKWGAIQIGETNPTYYVPDSTDPTIATSTDVTAETQWGESTPATVAYGTNVIRITGLTDEDLYLKTLKNTRAGLHGFQIINRGGIRKLVAEAGKTLTYTENTELLFEVIGSGTLLANGCSLDVTKATLNGCSLAAENNGEIVLKADQLDAIGGLTIPQGATLKIVTDSADAVIVGEAIFAMPKNTTIAGSLILVTPDGEQEATVEIADDILTAKFTANAAITGSAWWWDYEFDGDGSNEGSEGTALNWDNDRPLKDGAEYTDVESDGNQMLKLPSRPWRNVNNWPSSATFVMKAKAGTQTNGVLASFGSSAYGTKKTITLMTGENPNNGDMRLVLTTGTDAKDVIDLVENLSIPNATTSYHLYAFTLETVEAKTTVCVYVDGDLLATYTSDSTIALGTGFQIASVHGGCPGGLSRLADTDAATMDFLRVTNSVLSNKALKEMAKVYPYVSPNGKATRTVDTMDDTWVGVEAETPWSQMTLNDDATSTTVVQIAPNANTEVQVTVNETTSLALNNESVVYETLTVTGDGALTLTSDETNTGTIQVSGRTKIETNVTVSPAVKIGTVTVADDCTFTFDYSAYDFTKLYVNTTIPLTGLADMGSNSNVTVKLPEMPNWVTSAETVLDPNTNTWSLIITVAGELSAEISADGNWDSIAWRVGDIVIDQPDLDVLETMPLNVTANSTLFVNKTITVKALTITGEGSLIIAENNSNKLTVSGATTINTNVTVTSGAATLDAITINEGNTLTIKDKLVNVGSIAANNGTLAYQWTGTEDGVLSGAGAIKIAAGTVTMTAANGGYVGTITVDAGAGLACSGDATCPFGKGAIVNNGTVTLNNGQLPPVSGTGNVIVNGGKIAGPITTTGTLTIAGDTSLDYTAGDFSATPNVNGSSVVVNTAIAAGTTVTDATITIATGKTLSGTGTIAVPVTLADGATLAGAVTSTSNITLAGAVTITHATVAGDTVLTCANAADIVSALPTAPDGLKFVVEENTIKLAVAQVTVTLPTVANATWQNANGETITSITVGPNSDTTVTLVANEGYLFADGTPSKDVTITAGNEDSTATEPEGANGITAGAAKIEDTYYLSFDAALAAAEDDDTITLLAGVTATDVITIAKTVTIDLNGQTITAAEGKNALHVQGGNLTITDSATGGKIVATGAQAVRVGDNVNTLKDAAKAGTFTLEAGTLEGDYGITVWKDSTVSVKGGTVKGAYAISGNGYNNGTTITIAGGTIEGTEVGIYHPQTGTLTIAGGVISGATGIEMRAGTLAMSAGSVTGTGTYTLTANGNGSTVAGAAIAISQHGSVPEVTATITGGTITAGEGAKTIAVANTTADTPVCSITVAANIVAADTVAVEVPTLKLDVAEDGALSLCGAVAEANDTKYTTFAEAFATGADVTLLADTETPAFKITASVTIDLGGKTLTLAPQGVGSTGTTTLGIQILNTATDVTIKNGTIAVTEGNKTYTGEGKPIKMLINNYTNLTLTDVTLDGTNLYKDGDKVNYVLSNNSGTVTLDGATSITAPEGGVAFDVCKYSTYAEPTVTLNTTGTITGNVEVTGGTFTKTAGTITGDIVTGDTQVLVVDGNNYTVATAVAEANGTKYATFAEAFATGKDVKLLADAETPAFKITASVTIDLGGKVLTLAPQGVGSTGTTTLGIQILNSATNVTIKNGKIAVAEGNKTYTGDGKPIKMLINNYTNLTLTDVTLDGSNLYTETGKVNYVLSNNSGTVTLNGATSITAPEGGIAFDVCKYASYAEPSVTLNTTGTITGNVEVTGGTFTVENAGTTELTVVTGSGMVLQVSEDGKTYTVATAVAEANGTKYATFAEAFATGKDVSLLRDAETPAFKITASVTIDLGGKTLTLAPQGVGSTGTTTLGIQILNSATNVTIKNGKIAVAEGNKTYTGDGKPIKMLINNYTNLTLNNVCLDGTNLYKEADKDNYVLSNNSGNVALTGVTSIIAPEGGIAFDVCKYASYEAPTVTVAETVSITGTVELSGGELIASDNLTVESGVEGKKAVYANGEWTLVDEITLPEALQPSPAADAIIEAMKTAGVTELTDFVVSTKGVAGAAEVTKVADVLELFDAEVTVEAKKLTISYDFGISKIEKSADGKQVTITAAVNDGTTIREGVKVVISADGEVIKTISAAAGDKAVVTDAIDVDTIKGKKITVKATNE